MECKLNRISAEEMTDRVMNVRRAFIANAKDLSVGEAVEMVGLFLANVCHDVSNASNGTATKEVILGGIHHLAEKTLSYDV